MIELTATGADGKTYYPFTVEFESPEGKFRVILYATNYTHAELMLSDLKENGKVTGQLVGVIDAQ